MPLARLDELHARLEERSVPGLAIAWRAGDEISPVRGFGRRGPAPDAGPVDDRTVFAAGSISKPVTAYAALRLAAAGRLDLDADVHTLLGGWQLPAAGPWSPMVTTRMLLSHVAGLSGWGEEKTGDPAGAATVLEVIEGRGQWPPIVFQAPPNVVWSYSGGGYLVVQAIIERLTGRAFEAAMRELVFEPLAMTSSTFDVDARPDLAAHRASSPRKPTPPDPARADGGLWSTPADLLRFAGAVNAGAAPAMLEGHPVEPRMGAGLFLTSSGDLTWWSHGGSVDGFESVLAGHEVSGFAVAVMTNGPSGASVAMEAMALVGAQHGPGPVVVDHRTGEGIRTAIRMNQLHLEALGTYELPSGLAVELTPSPPDRWGMQSTCVTLPGQPTVELCWPFAPGRWRIPGLEAVVVYEPPDRLRILHSGQEVVAERRRAG